MFKGTQLFRKFQKSSSILLCLKSKVSTVSWRNYSMILQTIKSRQLLGLRTRTLNPIGFRGFAQKVEQEAEEHKQTLKAVNPQKMEFKAETRKLLDIVAKSIYTDKEVFVRELMSNASDALEKQRYSEVSGKGEIRDIPLEISVFTNERERTLTIMDHGIGMTKAEAIDNLGTIAKSGSQEFVKSINDNSSSLDSIIGQFGVGFYSSFIVADSVEVLSKSDKGNTIRWTSDGSGDFEVSEVEGADIQRGTRVTIFLKPDSKIFSKPAEIEKIIKKYSLFISYPIKLNGEVVNSLQALWYRDIKQVTEDEYDKFYETLANTKIPYKYLLHYSTDVPLAIKALLYIPSSNTEKFGMQQEASHLHLYSRKVLIKQKWNELLPHYLRFVKGVVDWEDIPLNISREGYQDSQLMAKLKNALTRRVVKMLEEEIAKDEEKYNKWYEEFSNYLKEGLSSDKENSELLLKLTRYKSTVSTKLLSLDDYISSMKTGQKNIYFIVWSNPNGKLDSPFLETFKESNIPVLVLPNHIDEVWLKNVNEYKGYKFVNIESNFEEVSGDLDKKFEIDKQKGVPEAELTPFSLWVKSELAPTITRVTVSKD